MFLVIVICDICNLRLLNSVGTDKPILVDISASVGNQLINDE